MDDTNELSKLQGYYGINPEKEKSIENENKDSDFEKKGKNATPEKTTEIKKGVADSLGYGKFTKPEGKNKGTNNEKGQDTNNEKGQDTNNENLYYPIFNRLFDAGKISKETLELLSKQLNQAETNFGKIEFKDIEEKNIILKSIEQVDSSQKEGVKGNYREFLNDFKEIDKKIEKKEVEGIDEELYSMIGKNYIKIETGNVELDKVENYSTAIKTSSNEIIKNFKNIPKDSVTYNKALENISSDNVDKQFEGLHSLYLLATTSEGAKGSKMEKNKKNISNSIDKRKNDLIIQFNNIETQIKQAKEQNNKDLYNKLNLEKNNIIDQAKEIDEGIFGGDKKIEAKEGNGNIDNKLENK